MSRYVHISLPSTFSILWNRFLSLSNPHPQPILIARSLTLINLPSKIYTRMSRTKSYQSNSILFFTRKWSETQRRENLPEQEAIHRRHSLDVRITARG